MADPLKGFETIEAHQRATGLRLYDEPEPNDRESYTIAEDDEHYYDVIPMLFNHRLVMTPKSDTRIWEYGWCYRNGATALLAMKAFVPEVHNEPVGWMKRPTTCVRTAPRALDLPRYNRPRCIHGGYTDTSCATDLEHCPTPRTEPSAA